jgi:hypothetical protein
MILFADEYAGDGDLTDYSAYITPLIFQKAGEGLGGYSWYGPHAAKAAAANITCGAYFWILFREDGRGQAQSFISTAPNADCYAVDVEMGPGPGSHAWNGDATKAQALSVMHAFLDAFHQLRPDKPLLVYGAAFMAARGITWAELVGTRDWCSAWLPRYSGGGDIRGWDTNQIIDYAEPQRYSVPRAKVAAVQFTDGRFGPIPHTLPGLNRNEDVSVLLVTLEQLTGGGDLSLTQNQQDYLLGMLKFNKAEGPPADDAPDATKRGYEDAKARFNSAMTNPPASGSVHDHPMLGFPTRTGKAG